MKFKNNAYNLKLKRANIIAKMIAKNDTIPAVIKEHGPQFIVFVVDCRFGLSFHPYYFVESLPRRCNVHSLYRAPVVDDPIKLNDSEPEFIVRTGFARGMREIAKDFLPVLSSDNI